MSIGTTIARLSENSPRARDWMRVFGSLEVRLLGPATMHAFDPFGRMRAFYQVDLDALTSEQRDRAIDHVALRFGIRREEVAETLADHGLPIAAEDVTVSFDARHFL